MLESEIMKGEIFGFSQFGNEEDLKGAARALVRLQSIYNLNTTSLARGNVLGLQTAAGEFERGVHQVCLLLNFKNYTQSSNINKIFLV